jgi:hypothetical protein
VIDQDHGRRGRDRARGEQMAAVAELVRAALPGAGERGMTLENP